MWSLIIGRDVENGLEMDFGHFLDYFRFLMVIGANFNSNGLIALLSILCVLDVNTV